MLPEEDIGHNLDTEADLKAVHIYRRFGRHIERCFRKLWGTRYTVLGRQCEGGRVWWTPTVQRQVTRSSGRSLLGRCELQLTRRPAELSRLFAVWIDKTLQFELHASSRSFSSSFDYFALSSISRRSLYHVRVLGQVQLQVTIDKAPWSLQLQLTAARRACSD